MSRIRQDYGHEDPSSSGFYSDFEGHPRQSRHVQQPVYVGPDNTIKRSHTPSERRSRKHSSASNRELIQVLLEGQQDVDVLQEQLRKTRALLEAESRRANDAERVAFEAKARLKGIAQARITAHQEASKAMAELKLYKTQFEIAQQQLTRANEIIEQTDQERYRAIQDAQKAKAVARKYKEENLAQRAREEGWRQATAEAMRNGVGRDRYMGFADDDPRSGQRAPLREDDFDEQERRDMDAENARGQQLVTVPQTPRPPSVAESVDRRTLRHSRPASTPIPENVPPVPDHIIVRSPAVGEPPRPSSTSSHGRSSRHSRHQSMPAYPSTDSETSSVDSAVRHSRNRSGFARGAGLGGIPEESYQPIQRTSQASYEVMATPAPTSNSLPRRTDAMDPVPIIPRTPDRSPERAADVIANLEAQAHPPRRRTQSHSSASSSGTAGSESTVGPGPPPVSRSRRSGGSRRYSSESFVPEITIQPPSRPESTDTYQTTTTRPFLLSPDYVTQPLPTIERPSSRRGERDREREREREHPVAGPSSIVTPPEIIDELPPGFIPMGPPTPLAGPGGELPPFFPHPPPQIPFGGSERSTTPTARDPYARDPYEGDPYERTDTPGRPERTDTPGRHRQRPPQHRREPSMSGGGEDGGGDYFTVDHQRQFGNQFRDPASLSSSGENTPAHRPVIPIPPSPLSGPPISGGYDNASIGGGGGGGGRRGSSYEMPAPPPGIVYPTTPGSVQSSGSSMSRIRQYPLPASTAGGDSRPPTRQTLRTPYRRPTSAMDDFD
ncbi:hypothetical protein BD410DRAFT_831488 [Rickenella mellea]|uniref:Uncharacterized protein n=1 Tax=Rickenella mellea TaxID=50990 RepID=A0A4Y7PR23_9AGAM|nr:hypothetical protein BD410DRAFT_831488 [Rickenella mellea]